MDILRAAGLEAFDNSILPPLQTSYIYEESRQSFRYTSAFLIKNATLQERYETFRTKRRNMGYSEEELEESYGFLLFEDKNKANTLAETGVVTGHSTCSTLGDPSKGVYISKYSDCLDLHRWYHGKSGYIAIIRLTKGRVKNVSDNYTQNFTSPSAGYDCHVSDQFSAVSANTSSFLAFERTQYYMYELLDDGKATAQSPSHVCPFAIVSFSYGDTKAPTSELQEKSKEEKAVFHYCPWKGQLQIGSLVYHVGLKSSTGALIPAKLPTVMKVDRAITMVDLKQLLPKAVFETCFTGEASLGGVCCSLYELVSTENEDSSLALLTQELREKDLALTVQLNDSGFLILLHSSQFLTYEDAGSNRPEVVQGMFVFPNSRAIQRDTKACRKKSCFSPDVIQVLPALSYAETELEKCVPEHSGELCGLMEQHIQSYAALIHPGLAVSPSREASIFPDQYDVPEYLYPPPVWTEGTWQHLQSYLNELQPYQLSVSRATELLAAGREKQGDEQDEDVYYCLSSPEGGPRTPASWDPEEQTGGESSSHADTPKDSNETDTRAKDKENDLRTKEVTEQIPAGLSQPPVLPAGLSQPPVLPAGLSQPPVLPASLSQPPVLPAGLSQPPVLPAGLSQPPVLPAGLSQPPVLPASLSQPPVLPAGLSQPPVLAEDIREPAAAVCTTADRSTEVTELSTLQTLGDLPTELVVSITSAQSTGTVLPEEETCGMINAASAPKDSVLQSSCFPQAELQVEGDKSSNGEFEQAHQPSELPKITIILKDDWRRRPRRRHRKRKVLVRPVALQANNKEDKLPKVTLLSKDDWRRRPRRRRKFVAQQANDEEAGRVLRSALKVKESEEDNLVVPPVHLVKRKTDKEPEKEDNMVVSPVQPLKRKPEKEDTMVVPPVRLVKRKPGKEGTMVVPQVHPLKKKTDQWDLKAITTKCGRIFVPHGSGDIAKDIQFLENSRKMHHEQRDGEMMVKASLQVPQPMETENGPCFAAEMEKKKAITETAGGENNSQNSEISEVNSEQTVLKKAVDNNDLLIKTSGTNEKSPEVNMAQVDSVALSATEPAASPSKDKGEKKRAFAALSFSKLKNVLSKAGKRKSSLPVVEDLSLVKKSKADMGTDKSECVDMSEAASHEPSVGTKPQPLDPNLARALGLAPTGLKDETRKTPQNDTQSRKDHPREVDPDTPQASQRLPSPLPTYATMGRMRPLQKRGVSAEAIKKKWWLHFHTPASYASERMAKNKSPQLLQVQSSHSVRKGHSLQDRAGGGDPPTDALTLLADLALSGSNDEVSPETDPALESKLGPSLEKGECLNSAGSPEPQSVLHDLLRCPTAKSSLPPKSSSPEGLEGSQEVVVLISTEHSYSLPPSSLPLGLSGALLHVSPLSRSEGLQQHRKNIYGDGTQALRAFLCQGDQGREELENGPECLNKGVSRRRKFRRSRRFVEKDGSIQVTRLWKENYDFHLDSKFTNHPNEKTVNRALHGTWDFSIKDTSDQIQLIIHMWIGLFYSRSTARFFQIDAGHASTVSDCEVLDLSKGGQKEAPLLSLGSEVLDLSIKNTDVMDLTVDRKDSREGPSVPHQDGEVVENVPSSSDVVGDMSDKRNPADVKKGSKSPLQDVEEGSKSPLQDVEEGSKSPLQDVEEGGKSPLQDVEEGSKSPLQKDVSLGDTDLRSLERDGSHIILCDTTASIQQENAPEAHGIGKALEGKDIPDPEQVERCSDGQEVEMVQPAEVDNSSKTKACPEVGDTSKGSHVDTVAHDENESRDDGHIEETQKQDHKANDFAEADPPAMDVATGSPDENMATDPPAMDVATSCPDENMATENDNLSAEAQSAVRVEEESIDKADIADEENISSEAHRPTCDRNVSEDAVQVEKRHETEEALPLVGNGSVPPELCEKNSSREEKTVAVGSQNVSTAQVQPEQYHEKEHEPHQRGNDSRDKSLHVLCNEPASIDEHSEVQDGNISIDDALPVENDKVRVGETPSSETLDETKCRHELLPENETVPVCDGSNLSVGETNTDSLQKGDAGETLGHVGESALSDANGSNYGDQEYKPAQDESKFYTLAVAVGSQAEIPLLGVGDFIEDITDKVGVDSNKDITHTKASHPQYEISEAVQDQKEIPLIAVHSNMDVTDTDIQADCNTDAKESEVGIDSNMYASKSEVGVDSNMDVAHSEISYPKDDPSDLEQGKIPLIGEGICREDITGTQISPPSYEADEIVKDGIEVPLVEEGITSKYTPHTKVLYTNSAQEEMSNEANSIAAEIFQISFPNEQMVTKKIESDKRCPTPTVDEIPYDYIPCPDSFNVSTAYGSDGVSEVLNTGKDYTRSSTPTQDELPFDHKHLEDGHTVQTVLLPNSEGRENHNLYSGLALEKEQVDELDTRKSPNPVEKELHQPRDGHNKPNDVEQATNLSLKSLSADPSPNLPSTSSEEDHTSAEHGVYTSLSIESLARLYDSSLHNNWISEEALSMPSNHLEHHSDKSDQKAFTDTNRASNSSQVSLEGDASFSRESNCKSVDSMQPRSTFISDKVTPTDLVTPNSNETRPCSQRPVMAVKPSKNEEGNGDNLKERLMKYPLTPDVLKTLQFSISAHTNTTVPITSTPLATEIQRPSERATGVSEETNKSEEPERDQDDAACNEEAEWLPKEQIVRTIHISKTKDLDSFHQYQEWETQENEVLDSNRPSTSSSSVALKSIESGKSISRTQKDWYNYCHSEVSEKTVKGWVDDSEEDFSVATSSIVTVLDHKGNRVTYENPIGKPSPNMHSRTIHNPNTTGSNRSLEEFSKKWTQSDLTQSSMDQECLIFSEKMNHMLKAKRRGNGHGKTSSSSRLRHNRPNEETGGSPVTVCFSNLKELDGSEEHWEVLPSLIGQTIKVVMPERSGMADKTGRETHVHLQKLSCAKGNEAAHAKVSDVAAECARSYNSMMDDVCAGKKLPSKPDMLKTDSDSSKSRPSNNTDLCGQMKREMYDNLHDQLNSVVRQSCKIKFRFFLLVTSADTFFKETKELLEAEGHCEVGPTQFFLDEEDGHSSPLLIILRNEDIAEHICEVPHLLELKKSPSVLFAGIDQADDIVNLTHQELFTKGGFVVFEGAALEVLSLCNMKRMSRFLEEMSKKGKWKWMIHYRDSRLVKEQARSSAEAQERKQFLDSCQEAGIVEVLPYHECDVISKERPNYLHCLVRLQVQNISARFPVFITDTTADNAFGKNGIMTMNINSFLLISQSDSCTIS